MEQMQPGDWVSLGAAVVAVLALIWTRGQARSAKEQAEAAKEQVALAKRQTEIQERLYHDQQQPYVWIDFRVDPVSYYLIDLVLKNEGPTVATNVRVTFDGPFGPVPPLTYALDYADGRFMALRDRGNLKALTAEMTKGYALLVRSLGRIEHKLSQRDEV